MPSAPQRTQMGIKGLAVGTAVWNHMLLYTSAVAFPNKQWFCGLKIV